MLWLTDIHIEHKQPQQVEELFKEINLLDVSGICITGDIAEKGKAIDFIKTLSEKVDRPIYFVLGNHDFYGSDIYEFQQKVHNVFEKCSNIFYLPSHNAIQVANNTALIGIDNWYDFSKGNYFSSTIKLKDFKEIHTFSTLSKEELFSFMQAHSRKLVDQIKAKLNHAFAKFSKVILLVHVPPFQEVCLYKSEIADEAWAPFFTHGFLGDFLKTYMLANPDKSLTVLAGHTHHSASYTQAFNLTAKVGRCPYEHFEWDIINL